MARPGWMAQTPHEGVCPLCDDCDRPTAEDDMAPSCGIHVLCVSCYNTSDFRCRECQRVWDEQPGEEKAARAVGWFARVSTANAPEPFPAYVEPEPPEPLDLGDVDVVLSVASSLHLCSYCDRGIHVGRPQVSYRPVVTHHFTLYFHESCVILR